MKKSWMWIYGQLIIKSFIKEIFREWDFDLMNIGSEIYKEEITAWIQYSFGKEILIAAGNRP